MSHWLKDAKRFCNKLIYFSFEIRNFNISVNEPLSGVYPLPENKFLRSLVVSAEHIRKEKEKSRHKERKFCRQEVGLCIVFTMPDNVFFRTASEIVNGACRIESRLLSLEVQLHRHQTTRSRNSASCEATWKRLSSYRKKIYLVD